MQRPGPGRRVLLGFVVLVVLVGTNLVAIRFSNRELPPFWNAGFRFALAAAIFAALVLARRPGRPSRRQLVGGTVYGLFSFAGFFAFVYLGLVKAPTAIGQTVLALNPLVTMFLAAALGMERIRSRAVAGAFVSLAGIVVAFSAATALAVPLTSLLAFLVATTLFASGALVARRLRGAEPLTQNLLATTVGAAILLPISVALGEPWRLPADAGTWLAFVYLVVPGTIGVFLLLLWLLRNWTATAVSYQFVLAPIVSITLAATLLGEAVGPSALVGAVLVIGGVYFGGMHGV